MNNDSFRSGDVCEVLPGESDLVGGTYIGQEGTIVCLCYSFVFGGEPRHQLRMQDGQLLEVAVSCLRKRRPPSIREQTSTWDDVIVWLPRAKETSNAV